MMAGLLIASCSSVQAAVTLSYEDPEEFSDFEYAITQKTVSTEAFSKEIIKYLERAVDNSFPEGVTLAIHFQDIDLAGSFEPWQRIPLDEVRFYRDHYPPRISLSYQLVNASGEVLADGEIQLKDYSYQMGVSSRNSSIDNFYYERRLLERWIKGDLAKLVSKGEN